MDAAVGTVGGRPGSAGARQGSWEMNDSNRDKIVQKIVAALQQHAPVDQQMQLEPIARRYENKIFCTALTSDEYFLQITKKLTSLKEKSAQREGMAGQPLGSVVSGQTSIMGSSSNQRSGMAQHLNMSHQGGVESMSGIQASIHGGGMQGGISAPPSTQGSIQGSCAQGLLNSRGYAGTGGMPSPQSLSGNGGGGNVGNGSGGNIIGTSAMSPQPYVSGQTSSAGGNMYGTSPAQMGQYRVQVGMQSATLQGNGGIQQVLPVQQSLTQTSAVGADGGGSDPDFMAMAMVFAEGPSSMGVSGSGSGSVDMSGGNAISHTQFNGVQMGGGGSSGSPSIGSQGQVASIGNRQYSQSQQQQLMRQQQQHLQMQQQQQQLLQQQQQRRLKNQMLVQQRQQQMQILQQQLLQQQGASGGLTQNQLPQQQQQQLLSLQQQPQQQGGMSVQGSIVGNTGVQGQQIQLSGQGSRANPSEGGGGNNLQQLKAMLETMRKSYLGELKTLHKVLSFNLKNHNSAQASQSSQIKRDTLSTKLSELYQMIQILEEDATPSSTMDLRRLVQLEKKIKMYISWFQQKISCLKNKKKDFSQAQPGLGGDVDGVPNPQQVVVPLDAMQRVQSIQGTMQPSPLGQQDAGFTDANHQLQQRKLQQQQAMMLQQQRLQQSGGAQQAGQTSQVQGRPVQNSHMQNLGSMQGGAMEHIQGGMSSTNILSGSVISGSTSNQLGVIDTQGDLGQERQQQQQQGTVQHGGMSIQSSNKSHTSSANQLLAAIRAQPPTRQSMARLTSASQALQQGSNGEGAELLSVGKVITGNGSGTNTDEGKPQLGQALNQTQSQTTGGVMVGGNGETADNGMQGGIKPPPSAASQELLEECRKACEEIPGLRLQADDAAAQAASAAMSVGGAPHGVGIQCWLQDSLSVFAPLLLLVPDGYPGRPPTVCFNSATASNAKLLEEARGRFLVAIKKMVPPHQLINVARAWKEAAESALSAHKESKDTV